VCSSHVHNLKCKLSLPFDRNCGSHFEISLDGVLRVVGCCTIKNLSIKNIAVNTGIRLLSYWIAEFLEGGNFSTPVLFKLQIPIRFERVTEWYYDCLSLSYFAGGKVNLTLLIISFCLNWLAAIVVILSYTNLHFWLKRNWISRKNNHNSVSHLFYVCLIKNNLLKIEYYNEIILNWSTFCKCCYWLMCSSY